MKLKYKLLLDAMMAVVLYVIMQYQMTGEWCKLFCVNLLD